jgi:hypothetical protein
MSIMRTKHALQANWNITFLAVGLTSLVGVKFTLRKSHLSVFEMNNVVLLVLEFVHVLINTVHTQTDLAVIAELLARPVAKVTGDENLGLGVRRGHCSTKPGRNRCGFI